MTDPPPRRSSGKVESPKAGFPLSHSSASLIYFPIRKEAWRRIASLPPPGSFLDENMLRRAPDSGQASSQRLVTDPRLVALIVVHDLAIRADALLGLVAPEETVARMRDLGVPLDLDVHALPAQQVAAILVNRGVARIFHVFQ